MNTPNAPSIGAFGDGALEVKKSAMSSNYSPLVVPTIGETFTLIRPGCRDNERVDVPSFKSCVSGLRPKGPDLRVPATGIVQGKWPTFNVPILNARRVTP